MNCLGKEEFSMNSIYKIIYIHKGSDLFLKFNNKINYLWKEYKQVTHFY